MTTPTTAEPVILADGRVSRMASLVAMLEARTTIRAHPSPDPGEVCRAAAAHVVGEVRGRSEAERETAAAVARRTVEAMFAMCTWALEVRRR